MTYDEAIAWLRGERSAVNTTPQEPLETWQERIAWTNAAMTEQAYWVARAHKEVLIMSDFKREKRYLVLKIKDINNSLTKEEIARLVELVQQVEDHHCERKGSNLKCVVVESDWPEYEPTWRLIEGRVNLRDCPTCKHNTAEWCEAIGKRAGVHITLHDCPWWENAEMCAVYGPPSHGKMTTKPLRGLLDCPFCGGRASMRCRDDRWLVGCITTDCPGNKHKRPVDGDLPTAVNGWNRRNDD